MNEQESINWRRLANRSKWPRKWWWPPLVEVTLTPEQWKKQHDEASNSINTVLVVIVGFSFFCALVLGAPDWKLLSANATVKLPFADTDVSYVYFLRIGPLILAGLAAYLQIIIGYWTNLSRLRPRSEHRPVPSPFVFNLENREARILTYVLFYWLVPGVMVLFVWKALPRPESPQLVATAFALIECFIFLMLRRRSEETSRIASFILWLALLLSLVLITVTSLFWMSESSSIGRSIKKHHPKLATYLIKWDLLLNRQMDLRNANLSGQDLENIYFWRSDLRRANLTGAYLAGSDLECADIACANLEGVDLFQVDGLTQQQVNSAIGDQNTKLPPPLVKPAAWSNIADKSKQEAICNMVLPQPAKISSCRDSAADSETKPTS